MKKVLFIDRDGTIIVEPQDTFQVDSLDLLEFLPGVIRNLYKIKSRLDYELVMVTNQDGLGTDSFPEENFQVVQDKMLNILRNEGILFSEIFIDKSFEHEDLPTRKPGIAMLSQYFSADYDLGNSYVIGDRLTDLQLAENLGAKGIYIGNKQIESTACSLMATSWDQICDFLMFPERSVKILRNTNETQVSVELNLDGKGDAEIRTGIDFFDHMLEQLTRHSGCDIRIFVNGDLNVDEHHTIEDTALALGMAFYKALTNKRGMERYGFVLPMDDCLAQVSVDFGGRPWLNWNVEFKRELIGKMPTEMFFHFFKSFSDEAKCNLDISATGTNEHHKIESIFKAFARSVKMAVKRNEQNYLPSTKGVL